MNHREPTIGETIYIPSSLYLDHGIDDVAGGKAEISKIINNDTTNEFNKVFVTVKGIKGHSWNWRSLLENQAEYEAEYKEEVAKEDPDYSESSNNPWS